MAIPLQLCAFHGMWDAYDVLADSVRASSLTTKNIRDALFVGTALRDPQREIQDRVLLRLQDERARSGTVPLGLVVFAYKLGRHDEVFDVLSKSSFAHLFDPESRSPGGWYNASILFAGTTDMSRDKRFLDLCGKMGLCDYWTQTSRWPDCADANGLDFDFRAAARRAASVT